MRRQGEYFQTERVQLHNPKTFIKQVKQTRTSVRKQKTSKHNNTKTLLYKTTTLSRMPKRTL